MSHTEFTGVDVDGIASLHEAADERREIAILRKELVKHALTIMKLRGALNTARDYIDISEKEAETLPWRAVLAKIDAALQ